MLPTVILYCSLHSLPFNLPQKILLFSKIDTPDTELEPNEEVELEEIEEVELEELELEELEPEDLKPEEDVELEELELEKLQWKELEPPTTSLIAILHCTYTQRL